jgi:hypothetical protein
MADTGKNGRNRTKNGEVIPANGGLEVLPPPRLNLNNLEAVRREMARVYRDMRGNTITTQDGARLVYVLGELRKVFEAVDLEQRIAALEGGKT